MKGRRSLKSRALQLLARRDQSPVELRRKLLAYARAAARESQLSGDVKTGAPARPGGRADTENTAATATAAARGAGTGTVTVTGTMATAPAKTAPNPELDVSDVLDWLREQGFLSEQRFAESRVHVRLARFGNSAIRQELARHGVVIPVEVEQELAASEAERAAALVRRRFPQGAATVQEAARRARWLASRGFSGDVIRAVLRRHRAAADEDP